VPSSKTATSSANKGRAARGPKRFVTQSTKLESVDDSLGPLGPLGDNFPATQAPEETVTSPQSGFAPGPQVPRETPAGSNASLRTLMGSVNLDDEDEGHEHGGPRVPPPVQPPSGEAPQRQVQPSMSVVEASKPSFYINVGDPHKVGDLTGAHTEYSVYTKVIAEPIRVLVPLPRPWLTLSRPLPKHIATQSLPFRVDFETSFGSIINFTLITPA
jgi:sorting nexin-1/2